MFIRRMPPKGTCGSAPKSKKKMSEGTTAELIDILKPGSDENIERGDSIPVVELDKIDSPHRSKFIPYQTPGDRQFQMKRQELLLRSSKL